METIFLQGLNKKEGEGLRITLSKEDKDITPSGIDFKVTMVDNQFNTFPEVHISYQDAIRVIAGLKQIIKDHHNLFKSERKSKE